MEQPVREHYLAHLVLLGCMLGAFLWFYFRKEKPPGGPKKP